MTRRGTTIAAAALILLLAWRAVLAQTSGNSPGGVSFPRYKTGTSVLESLITGSNMTAQPGGWVQLQGFNMIEFQNGQTNDLQFTAQSPHCHFQTEKSIACDSGPLVIFTPTNKLQVKGMGYFCAESNQVLILSNQVETHVVKSFFRGSLLSGSKTNGADQGEQVMSIFSDHGEFDYLANQVHYATNVRVEDPQFNLRSPFLDIVFTNGEAVERVVAWQPVAIDLPGRGQATGDTATYSATNGAQLLELNGHAEWHNGGQSATAVKFDYDPDRHFLTADDTVHVRWPAATNADGRVLFRELFADHATLQMSPDGAWADEVTAAGNVIIVNQSDGSRSMGSLAYYNRTNDIFELKPQGDWWNDQMEVWGDTLSVAPNRRVQRATGHARMRHRLGGASTNQFLEVTADEIVAETNLVTFRGEVRATLLDGRQWRDKLAAELLLVTLDSSNQIQSLDARGSVRAETAPDALGVKKTLSSRELTADFWPGQTQLQLRTVQANGQVLLDSSAGDAGLRLSHLGAEQVTAHFSSSTNVMESAEAEGAVDFQQTKNSKSLQATGDRGTYSLNPDERYTLSGHAWARNDNHEVTGADRLQYLGQTGQMRAFGQYHIEPARLAKSP